MTIGRQTTAQADKLLLKTPSNWDNVFCRVIYSSTLYTGLLGKCVAARGLADLCLEATDLQTELDRAKHML